MQVFLPAVCCTTLMFETFLYDCSVNDLSALVSLHLS
jgi:hypothetical protein